MSRFVIKSKSNNLQSSESSSDNYDFYDTGKAKRSGYDDSRNIIIPKQDTEFENRLFDIHLTRKVRPKDILLLKHRGTEK